MADDCMKVKDLEEEEEEEQFYDCLDHWSKDDVETDSFFDFMPDEVVIKIMTFIPRRELLSTVVLLSKRFYHLSSVASLWQQLDIPDCHQMSLAKAQQLLKKAPALRVLSIQRREDADTLACSALESCPRLNKLDLISCKNMTSQVLETIGNSGQCLKSLSLWSTNLDPGALALKSHYLTAITHLDLFNCKSLGNQGLMSITDHCKQLEYFNMEEVNNLSNDAIKYFFHGVQNTLERLRMDGEDLNDDSFKHVHKCRKLSLLSVNFADGMGKQGLDAITKLPLLTNLKLRRGKCLLTEDLISAFQDKRMHRLTSLNLSECSSMEDSVLISISDNCPHLVKINLDWCWDLTDHGVKYLIRKCCQLKEVELVGLVKITSRAFDGVENLLPDLRILNLIQCPDIDDNHLKHVANSCPQLKVINYWAEQVVSQQVRKNLDDIHHD